MNLRSAEGNGKVGKVVWRGAVRSGAMRRTEGAEYHGIPAVAEEAVAPRREIRVTGQDGGPDFGQDPDGRCAAPRRAALRRAASRRVEVSRIVVLDISICSISPPLSRVIDFVGGPFYARIAAALSQGHSRESRLIFWNSFSLSGFAGIIHLLLVQLVFECNRYCVTLEYLPLNSNHYYLII